MGERGHRLRHRQQPQHVRAGAVGRQQFGNKPWESIAYNDRVQPEDMRLDTTQDGSQVWRSRLSYNTFGNRTVNVGAAKAANHATKEPWAEAHGPHTPNLN